MPTDDEQSNGAAGFASSDVKEFLVGVNRMNLRSDKLGSKDRTPSHDSRSSRHHRRRRITSSSDECNRRGDGGDDGSSSTSPANQEDVAEEANHVDGPPEDSIICQACCEIVPPTSDHVIIKPCMHTHCNLCIIKSQVERGWRPHKCPAKGCDCESETLEYVLSSGGGSEEICKPTSDLRTFPALYLKENHKNEIMASSNNQGIAISCTKAKLNQDGEMVSNTWTSTFVIRKNSDDTVDVLDTERALKEIGKVFALMHTPIAKSSHTNMSSDAIPVLSPREYLDLRCRSPRLLDLALFAMSTGKKQIEVAKYLEANSPTHQKQYLAAITSSDILLHNLRNGPGIFQKMIGALLQQQQITRDFIDLCSLLNLAPSRGYTMKARAKTVLTQLKAGIDVGARDLVFLFFDNVGFKILGRQASYDQWIVINIVVVPEADLKAVGFYNDEASEDQRISRAPDHYWDEEVNDITEGAAVELTKKIVGIQEIDFERLSYCVLENIRYVLVNKRELCLDNQQQVRDIPRFDRIVSPATYDKSVDLMVNGHRNSTGTDTAHTAYHHHSVTIPRNRIPNDIPNELGGNNLTQSVNNPGIVETGGKNQYEMNHTTMQVERLDLSKTTTVESIADYMVRNTKNQLAKWEKAKASYPESAEPPLAEIIIGCGCDGQPAEALRKILQDDACSSDRKYPSTMVCSFGGFHTVMKGLNASGEYFQVLLRDIWSAYRDSIDKQNWVIFPSDPRQREEEYSFHLLANYAVAAENLRKSLGRDVSAVEVNDFMIDRAKQYPICALALLEIRIGSVMKLLRNSEKLGPRGCVSTFLTAIRLLMPLFAVTHKTDYMRLCQNLLRWYYCVSPAERKIYDEFIFTQLTSNGNPIFHDNSVENAVKDLRGLVGKVYRQGMGIAMETAAAEIPLSARTSSVARDLRNRDSDSTSRSRTHDTITSTDSKCPYFKIAAKYNAMRIWSVGVAPVIQGKRKGTEVECNDTILEVPGGGEIHSMILSAYSELGRARTQSHFMEYFIYNEDNEKTMSDKTVDLTKIDFTAEVSKSKCDEQVILQTSTTAKELEKFTKDILMERITNMRNTETNKSESERVNISEPVPKKSANKTRVIEYLVKWRIEVFKKNPAMKDILEEEVKARSADNCRSTKDSRGRLLDDTIFRLSDSVRQNERYTAAVNLH